MNDIHVREVVLTISVTGEDNNSMDRLRHGSSRQQAQHSTSCSSEHLDCGLTFRMIKA